MINFDGDHIIKQMFFFLLPNLNIEENDYISTVIGLEGIIVIFIV